VTSEMAKHEPPTLDEIREAAVRIAGSALRTPLVKLNLEDAPAEIWLKLENIQPIGSFKIRGATNAVALADPGALRDGIWTASAGNMGQGVAWAARELGVRCTVVVPDTAPEAKLSAIERLGATIVPVPFMTWQEVFATRRFEGVEGLMIHPFSDPNVMAGNATIGVEIVEDLPDVDAVLVPYGGGGLSCAIAAAVKPLRASAKVFAVEVETGAPLAPSLAAGQPVEVEYQRSFVDGIGGSKVFPEMFDLATRLLDGSLVSSVADIAGAVRLLAVRNHVVAEGAGASGVAAALAGKAGKGRIACVISGGNIDAAKLATILGGGVP
jgi:threonine dehydratase